ncbi:aspartate-semialdehyde dehydrogenase [Massospora cicadina]|nr:aspartate-semialdehyde dehydrogenase [Massospora cicadina]
MSSQRKFKVGILGATGTVGQRFITLLANHPQFEVMRIGASSRSAGKPYKTAVAWKMTSDIPEQKFQGCHVIFSGLDSEYAGDIEMRFLEADFAVFSNAKNYRRDSSVPLVVPLVNADHLDLIPHQRKVKNLKRGFLVTNANCSTTGLVVALKPLVDAFGPLDQVNVHTMQAISGAGYPGCSALDILDNVVPYINGEEEKMEWEPRKILGSINQDLTAFELLPDTTRISATCNRVPVIDGHTINVQVKFHQTSPSPEEVEVVMTSYVSAPQKLACATSPDRAIYVTKECDRPQPKLDRGNGGGNAITVGRIRACPCLDIKFTLLVHNTVLGAAGSSILNAEIAVAKGFITL